MGPTTPTGRATLLEQFKVRYARVWTFLTARFARGEYLGLHLTIGFLISALGLWIFLGVTEDVIHHDPITQFDLTLLNWLQAHRGRWAWPSFSGSGSRVSCCKVGLPHSSEAASSIPCSSMRSIVRVLIPCRWRSITVGVFPAVTPWAR